MEEQEEEQNHHGSDEREGDFRSHLAIHAVESAEFHRDTLRNVGCLEVSFYGLDGCRLALSELHVGSHYYGRLTVDAGERGRLPFRSDGGHLTDGNHNTWHGRRDEGVGDILVGGV